MYLYGRLINSVLMCYQLHVMLLRVMCHVVCGDDACLGTRGHGDGYPETMDPDPQIGWSGMVTKKYVTLLDLT